MKYRLFCLMIIGVLLFTVDGYGQLELLAELQHVDIRLQMKMKGKTKLEKLNSEKRFSYTEVRDYDDYLLDKIIFNNWFDNYGLKVTYISDQKKEEIMFFSRKIKGAFTNKKSNQPTFEFNHKNYGLSFDENPDKEIKFTVFYSYYDDTSDKIIDHIIDEFTISYYY